MFEWTAVTNGYALLNVAAGMHVNFTRIDSLLWKTFLWQSNSMVSIFQCCSANTILYCNIVFNFLVVFSTSRSTQSPIVNILCHRLDHRCCHESITKANVGMTNFPTWTPNFSSSDLYVLQLPAVNRRRTKENTNGTFVQKLGVGNWR